VGLGDPYLERMTVIPSGAETLEGLYHTGRRAPACVVAPPHPALGGSMDALVCAQLAWAVTRAEHAALRFNYRGVGASTGTASGDLSDLRDLRAAVDSMAETVAGVSIALIGYSFGAYLSAALAAEDARVSHCVLVAPPTERYAFDLDAIVNRGVALTALLAEHDPYCTAAATSAAVIEAGGTVHVIGDDDHFFQRGLSQLGRYAAAALTR
jgi:alpha/beta superfamily hydrolase